MSKTSQKKPGRAPRKIEDSGQHSRRGGGASIPYIVMTGDGPLHPPGEFPWSGSWSSDMTTIPGTTGQARGQLLYLFGTILDFQGQPVEGAVVEIWQADDLGRYKHPRAEGQEALDPYFLYFSSVRTNQDGFYLFKTIVPRYYHFGGAVRAPHIHLKMRSLANGVQTTQVYFDGAADEELQAKDRVFLSFPEASRSRMIVSKESPAVYAGLGIEFASDALCARYDLAFPF